MDHVVAASVGQPRLLSALTGLFGGLAGLLAMVGIYGVMAYHVRRQRREYGIRLALGVVGSLWLTQLLQTMLNDVKPSDPAVFAATAGGVLLVALVASYLPARSAGRVDPMVVLRDS